jgi:hypothetical protein
LKKNEKIRVVNSMRNHKPTVKPRKEMHNNLPKVVRIGHRLGSNIFKVLGEVVTESSAEWDVSFLDDTRCTVKAKKTEVGVLIRPYVSMDPEKGLHPGVYDLIPEDRDSVVLALYKARTGCYEVYVLEVESAVNFELGEFSEFEIIQRFPRD